MAIPSDNYSIGYGVGRLNFTMHLVMHVQFPSTPTLYTDCRYYMTYCKLLESAPTVQRYGIVLISDNKEPQQWRM